MVQEKIIDIDQQILKLVKTDTEEFEILKAYDKIEEIKIDIQRKELQKKKQKRLVVKMIANKNKEALAQQNLIKELTKNKKREANEVAEREVEDMLSNEFTFSND